MAPLSENFRRLAGAPILIIPVTQSWESITTRGMSAFVEDGNIHVFYQTDKPSDQPSIGYAITKGA